MLQENNKRFCHSGAIILLFYVEADVHNQSELERQRKFLKRGTHLGFCAFKVPIAKIVTFG